MHLLPVRNVLPVRFMPRVGFFPHTAPAGLSHNNERAPWGMRIHNFTCGGAGATLPNTNPPSWVGKEILRGTSQCGNENGHSKADPHRGPVRGRATILPDVCNNNTRLGRYLHCRLALLLLLPRIGLFLPRSRADGRLDLVCPAKVQPRAHKHDGKVEHDVRPHDA